MRGDVYDRLRTNRSGRNEWTELLMQSFSCRIEMTTVSKAFTNQTSPLQGLQGWL